MRRFLLLSWVSVSVLCIGTSAHATTRILVFPFEAENSVPRWEWLKRGLAAEIELRLLRLSSADVSVYAEYVPREQTVRAARAFGYRTFVRGSYRIDGGFVQIRAEVVDTASPDMARVVESRSPSLQPLRVLDELCASLPVSADARLLRSEAGVLKTSTTKRVPAFEAYVEGLSIVTRLESEPLEDLDLLAPAILSFRKAADLDPAFYGPYYQLGRVYEMFGDREKAVAAYGEALKRVPGVHRIEDRLRVLAGKGGVSSL